MDGQELERFESTQFKMGTTFKIIFYALDSATAVAAVDSCWRRLDELILIFSDYESESECTSLSKRAGSDNWVRVSNDMWSLLQWSDHLSQLSEGTFDVTFGNLTKLWRRAIRHGKLPSNQRIEEAKNNAGYHLIEYNHEANLVRLSKEGISLDFGGVAKGYAVDQLYKILVEHRITIGMVDGGGDLYLGDKPPNKIGWKIKTSKDEVNFLHNIAIATSGDMYKHVWSGKSRYSHIINPHTGYGAKHQGEAYQEITVFADNCMTADALATTLSLLDLEKHKELLKEFPSSSYFISFRENKNK